MTALNYHLTQRHSTKKDACMSCRTTGDDNENDRRVSSTGNECRLGVRW